MLVLPSAPLTAATSCTRFIMSYEVDSIFLSQLKHWLRQFTCKIYWTRKWNGMDFTSTGLTSTTKLLSSTTISFQMMCDFQLICRWGGERSGESKATTNERLTGQMEQSLLFEDGTAKWQELFWRKIESEIGGQVIIVSCEQRVATEDPAAVMSDENIGRCATSLFGRVEPPKKRNASATHRPRTVESMGKTKNWTNPIHVRYSMKINLLFILLAYPQ